MLSAQAGQLVVFVGSTAVLARILTPRDFGLMAMAATLLNVVRILKTSASQATVHQPEIDHRLVSGAFWLNLRLTATITTPAE